MQNGQFESCNELFICSTLLEYELDHVNGLGRVDMPLNTHANLKYFHTAIHNLVLFNRIFIKLKITT